MTNRTPMTDEELRPILEQHELWESSRKKEGAQADLTGRDLTKTRLLVGKDLSGMKLVRANLSGLDLTGVRIWSWDNNIAFANFSDAILTGAKISNAANANFSGADLTNATIRENIAKADFSGADLTGTKFRNNTGIENAIFKDAKNLDKLDIFVKNVKLKEIVNAEIERQETEGVSSTSPTNTIATAGSAVEPSVAAGREDVVKQDNKPYNFRDGLARQARLKELSKSFSNNGKPVGWQGR